MATSYKFGAYELDISRLELRYHDRLLKLERIPTQLLILLLEKKGQVVSRGEIIERLWGKDVFLDTDHGINTSVRKIRMALKEDVERPRFIQTVSGKGYRFVPDEVITNAKGTAASAKISVAADEVLTPASIERSPNRTNDRWISRKWLWAAVALLLVAGVTFAFNVAGVRDLIVAKNKIGQIHSVAVLPLANMSGDPSQDYYADGMTDELITALARNRSLRVVSRTSAMQYKGVNRPLREIAQALGVDGILEGSVNRSADHVHMNLQLIYAPTDTNVWAESYDRDLSTAMSLPDELSQTIAGVAKTPSTPILPRHNLNPAAHDAYLMGHYLWMNGNNEASRKYFEEAIRLQPDYAAAWSGVADSLIQSGDGAVPNSELVEQAEPAARKALELDDSSPEAHHTMAFVYVFGKWDWNRADAESHRAFELDPNFSEDHHLHSYILLALNRPQEALQEQKRATEIDPFLRPWALGRFYIWLRQYDAAIEELRMRAQADTSAPWVHNLLARAYEFKGMDKEFAQETEQNARINFGEKAATEVHQAYERGGKKAVLQLQLNDLQIRQRQHYVSPWDLAVAYAALGMKDATLESLDEAYRQHTMWLIFLQWEPAFDFLHAEPRYRALVKKMEMPPAY
ncbi:MAG TPA: winged helix-turn-helix domain-containing protein [Terriglobales bacterium]|nr:winged helix-turn-helix domain-containing protein [Terriglobales bacterium]